MLVFVGFGALASCRAYEPYALDVQKSAIGRN